MQSKGAIKLVTALLILACLYQLSFTLVTNNVEKKAKKYAETALAESNVASLDERQQSKMLDSLNVKYLDSVAALPAYPLNLFTYKQCKEKELLLGLDLKGGMNVMLEVSVADMVNAMANHSTDPSYIAAMDLAKKNSVNSGKDFLTLFKEAWEQVAPNKKMSQIFGTYQLRDRIKPESTNDEVIKVIEDESTSAINNSFNVLRNRIDRFGVVSPNIQRIGNTGRILVELPGVKEPERVRKLLQGTANLEFWETFDVQIDGIADYIADADRKIKASQDMKHSNVSTTDSAKNVTDSITSDSTKQSDILADVTPKTDTTASAIDEAHLAEQYPLLALLNAKVERQDPKTGKMYVVQPMAGARIGLVNRKDTSLVNRYLALPQVAITKPANLRYCWSNKPIDADGAGVVYELVAIKTNPRYNNKAPLDGEVITDARKEFDAASPFPNVSMTMNSKGANIWARLTADNINKQIAVVLDGYVYSYPNVNGEITGGRSQITGNFSTEEADDLVNVLRSGKMPAPARIVQEAVVGPTLGKESINAGMFSFILAFIAILIFLYLFYNTAGLAADIALLVNVLLIFGVLASFGAVLTMPGIAGIVLTLGMAIDANIIIYERIKEETAAGKALRLAITDGYKNAYSAIIDGQLTTLITGIVLLIFGSGPVRGFATTLIIGIITSLFTSIFISRLIFEWLLNKGKNIKFGFPWSLNFLKNKHYDFIGKRKYAYIFSVAILAIGLIVIFTKGFSYGVDFTGGRTYVVRFDKPVRSIDIRDQLMKGMNGEASEVKQFGAADQMKITTKYKYSDQSEDVDKETEMIIYNALKSNYEGGNITFDEFVSTQTNPLGIISSEKVGPTIASDITRSAIYAVIIALIAIFIYIAIRFKHWEWGLGGVLALAHDTLFTLSLFAIGAGLFPWSMEVDQTFIAAILTIIGYSINDTVIIFDRIREYNRVYPKRDLKDNINNAINSTLTRTINTSFSTLLVLLAIFFFGGDVIRGFAFAMLMGVIIGTYSTIFIATPISYEAIKRFGGRKKTANAVKPELLKR